MTDVSADPLADALNSACICGGRGRLCRPCQDAWKASPERERARVATAGLWETLNPLGNGPDWVEFKTWAESRPRTVLALVDALDNPKVTARCKKYGITPMYFALLLKKQDGCCAICRVSAWRSMLNIDHDHESGDVRGLLCTPCNTGLGHLRIDGASAVDRARVVLQYVTSTPSASLEQQIKGSFRHRKAVA